MITTLPPPSAAAARALWTDPIRELLLGLPEVRAWSELAELVRRPLASGGGDPTSWDYVRLACEAVGGEARRAVPAMAAILCLHVAISLVDDLLDDDSEGLHHRLGVGPAANLAAACQALASRVLAAAELAPVGRAAMQEALGRAALATARGQQLDLRRPEELSDEAYWRLVDAKTPPLFGAALVLGALAGGAALEDARALEGLATPLGRMIQIGDDMTDALATPALDDWRRPWSNLALLYAQLAEHDDRSRFLELLARVHEPAALAQAQQILGCSGALSYCCYRLLTAHRDFRGRLGSLSLRRPEKLAVCADEIVRPLAELLERHGFESVDLRGFETPASVAG